MLHGCLAAPLPDLAFLRQPGECVLPGARKWERRLTRIRRDNANARRTGIGSGPNRRPRKRAICVHPFLSVCICVFIFLLPEQARNRRKGAETVQAGGRVSDRTTNNRSHGVTLFAVDDRTTAFFVAAVRLRCERFVAAVTDGTHATPAARRAVPLTWAAFPTGWNPSASCRTHPRLVTREQEKTEQRSRGRRGQAAPRRWGQGRRKAGVNSQ